MFSSSSICPQCKANSLDRSHRRLIDWPLSIAGFLPTRCGGCGNRFYVRRSA